MLKLGNIWLTLSLYILTFTSFSVMADNNRQQELQHLIKHDCGSCHGMTLKGGLGPALLSSALKDKPDELLYITIKEGRPGTPMPAWKSLLSDEDIHSIVKLLRQGIN